MFISGTYTSSMNFTLDSIVLTHGHAG